MTVDFIRGVDPIVQPYLKFWTSQFDQAGQIAHQMLAGFNGAVDPRDWQQRWLEAVRQSLDAYMRSPLFLSAMRQNLDAVVKAKMQTDDWYQEFARNSNIPTAHDISGLFERLRTAEQLILDQLEAIEGHLEAIKSGIQPAASGSGEDGAKEAST